MRDSTIKLKHKLLLYLVSIIIIYLGLFCLYFIVNDEFIFPSPNQILIRFINILGEAKCYLLMLNTIKTLAITILISTLIGGILGILAGLFKALEYILKPIMRALASIPLVGLILVIMVLSGLNTTMYYVTPLILIPIFYNGFLAGTKGIDKNLIDVYHLDSSFNLKVAFRVYIPLMGLNLNQALIDALGMGIKVVVMCEFMCGISNTLGGRLISLGNALDYEGLYAYCFLLVIIVMLIEFIPTLIKRLINYIQFNRQKQNS